MLKEIITSKAGFPFYTDYWKSYFCKMTGEQVKECLRIIFHFNETFEILESGDLAIEMVVTTIIGNIKRDAEKRTKQILANQENGSKGGRPPKDTKPKKNQLIIEQEQFESFWNLYDKKKSRPDAEKKFKAALKKDTFENIIAGLEKYIKARGSDSQYWKHPSTWLHNECWKDEHTTSNNASTPKDSFCQSLNQSLGQDLIKSLIEGEIVTIKLTSASANDKWDALSQDLKDSVLAKVKAKFGKETKISF